MRLIRWCLAVVGCLAIFGLAWWGWEKWQLPPSGSDRLSVALAVAAALSAALGAPLFWWAGRDTPANARWGKQDSHDGDGWLIDVQRKMRSVWVEEALRGSLETVAAIELQFADRSDAVVVPMRQRRFNEDPTKFPRGAPILSIFDSDNTERRLLILGEPGSGKTTQLLHLAESMLDQFKEDSNLPVPIYLPLSAGEWKEITLKRPGKLPPAIDWFTEQISSKYQVPKRKVVAWLESDPCPVVLLLDGLDEISSKDQRLMCVRALSQARSETHAGMVVSCRTNDYYQIGQLLKFGSAIEILPLTVSDINEYLAAAEVNLESLRQAVSNDGVIATLLDSPLMLCIAAMVYKGRDVGEELLAGSLESRRSRLWQAYESTMLTRRRNPQVEYVGDPAFPPNKTSRYLRYLARSMDRQRTLDFHPCYFDHSWLPYPWNDVLVLMSIVRALLMLAFFAYAIWNFCNVNNGLASGIAGIISGSISALVGLGILFMRSADNEYAAAWRWDWAFAGQVIFSSAIFAAFVMTFFMLGGKAAIAFGGLWGLGIGLSVASVGSWQPLYDGAKARIRSSVWNVFLARISTLALCGTIGFLLLPVARNHHVNFRSPVFIVPASSCGGFAAAALFFSIDLLVDHYCTRILAASRRLFPFRAHRFLNHANERILLRRVGSHYRFLHLTFRDHLAGRRSAVAESADPGFGQSSTAPSGYEVRSASVCPEADDDDMTPPLGFQRVSEPDPETPPDSWPPQPPFHSQ